jgi:hypothetical protein
MNLNADHCAPAGRRAAQVSDEQLLAMKPLKPRKKATFESPSPSNYCHICSRTPNRGIRLAICHGLKEGHCRKVVCERCFAEHPLGRSFEEAAAPAAEWKCTHCQGTCPERAQCRTYQTVNKKLRLQRLRQSAVDSDTPRRPHLNLGAPVEQKCGGGLAQRADPQHLGQTRAPSATCGAFLAAKVNETDDSKSVSPSSVTPAASPSPDAQESNGSSAGRAGYCRRTALSARLPEGDAATAVPPVRTVPASRVATNSASPHEKSNAAPTPPLTACHVCGRRSSSSATSSFSNCAGLQDPECTNAFCDLCATSEASVKCSIATALESGARWNCTHCTGTCPPGSSCHRAQRGGVEHETVPVAVGSTIHRRRRAHASLKSRLLAAAAETL